MTEKVKLLPVIRADRELAIFLGIYPGALEGDCRRGEYDDTDCIQSIARHRIAAEQTLNGELVEALRELVTAVTYADPPKEFNGVLCHEARVPVEFITNACAALAAPIAGKGGVG